MGPPAGFRDESILVEAILVLRQAGGSRQASDAWDAWAVSLPGATTVVRSALLGEYAEKSAGPVLAFPEPDAAYHQTLRLLVVRVAVALCTRAVARSVGRSCAALALVATSERQAWLQSELALASVEQQALAPPLLEKLAVPVALEQQFARQVWPLESHK